MKRNTAIPLTFLLLLVAALSQVTTNNAFAAGELLDISEKWLASNAGGEDTIHSLVIDNGYLYVEAGGIYGSSILYCLNLTTGSQVWNCSIYYLSYTVAKGLVYVAGTYHYNNTGCVLCLDAQTGAELWKNNLTGRGGKITVANNCLYVITESEIYSFNAQTGVKSWEYPISSGNRLVSYSVVDGYICTVSITDQYSSPYLSYIYALNASTGYKLWSQKIFSYTLPVGYSCSICMVDGAVFVLQGISSLNSAGYGIVWAFDARNGGLLWKYGINGVPSNFAVEDKAVYVAVKSGGLFGVNASNGSELWSYNGNLQFGSIIVANGYLYVSTIKGVACFSMVSGLKIWDYQASDYNTDPTGGSMVDDLLPTTPTYADGVVYFGWNGPQGWLDTTEHKFYALSAHTGDTLWTDNLSYRFQAPPVAANNTLYLGGSAVTTKSPTWVGSGAVTAINLPSTAMGQSYNADEILVALLITAISLLVILFIIQKTRKKTNGS